MAKTIFFRQCKFAKRDGTHCWEQTSWIPERFAVRGKVLKFRGEDGTWDDGGRVLEVYPHRRAEPEDATQSVKRHRKATGDAQPRTG